MYMYYKWDFIMNKRMLDDGIEVSWNLEHHRNQCTEDPSAQCEESYFGFQGALNPINTNDLSCSMFRI